MKFLLMAIAVPDCFTMQGDEMLINIKGMPRDKYIKAQVFKKESDDLNRRLQEETDKAFDEYIAGTIRRATE